jgi:hypothetical protein
MCHDEIRFTGFQHKATLRPGPRIAVTTSDRVQGYNEGPLTWGTKRQSKSHKTTKR